MQLFLKFSPTGGPEAMIAQASQRGNSDTSGDSDYERYHIPEPPAPTTVNNCKLIYHVNELPLYLKTF